MTPEGRVQKALMDRVRELGGVVRKVRWEGRRYAPDLRVAIPARRVSGPAGPVLPPILLWVEVKAPGEKPTPGQLREHARMRAAGERVEVVDCPACIEEALQ